MPSLHDIDWELVFKAIGAIVGAFVSLYQLRNIKPRLRSTLKSDIEILNLLKPDEPGYRAVKEHVDSKIRLLYKPLREKRSGGLKIYSWPDFALGIIFLPGFLIWTVYLFRGGFNGWGLVTAFFAIAGLGGIINGLEKPAAPPVKAEITTASAPGTK
ncbi:MAG: hypothetical protein ACOYVF_13910 [Candidatus Zixiibacteriota bacterium]